MFTACCSRSAVDLGTYRHLDGVCPDVSVVVDRWSPGHGRESLPAQNSG